MTPHALTTLQYFLEDLIKELTRSHEKFPSPDGMLAAIFEEGGEVARAMMDQPWSEVRKECVQLAVTALRLAVEGDPTLRGLRVAKGLDYLEDGGRRAEGGGPEPEVHIVKTKEEAFDLIKKRFWPHMTTREQAKALDTSPEHLMNIRYEKREPRSQREDGIVDMPEGTSLFDTLKKLDSDKQELNLRLIERTQAYEKREAHLLRELEQMRNALEKALIVKVAMTQQEAPHA